MSSRSIVSGYIELRSKPPVDMMIEQARLAIASYHFDEVWPFTNIFWCDSPARFRNGVVAFAGSYKEVEYVWSQWLWQFSQLLSKLEAIDARVALDCTSPIRFGYYNWRLIPAALRDTKGAELPASLIGQEWGVIEAPEPDFSIDSNWLAMVEQRLGRISEQTGKPTMYKWDKFVPRWVLDKHY